MIPVEFDQDQREAVAFFAETPKGILALDMGMGKTAVSLIVAKVTGAERILIICPPVVKIHWLREVIKWRTDLIGSIQVIHKLDEKLDKTKRVHIVPYTVASHKGPLRQIPKPDIFILDEMHYCKSSGAQRTRTAVSFLKKVDRAVLLSGTPMPNRPIELWPILLAMRVFKNKNNYGRRYCAGWFTPWNRWDFTGASNLDELREKLKPYMFHRKSKDKKARPPRVIEMDLPLDRREKALDRAEIERLEFSIAFEAYSDIAHQSAVRKVPLAVKHIKDILESEQKVVVFAHHRDVLDLLMDGLKDYNPVMVRGGTVKPHLQVAKFQEDEECRVFLGNITAAGVGIDLTAAAYVVFVECTWVPGELWQAIARCDRRGQTRAVRTDILTIHRSIDAHILHGMLSKDENINTVVQETPMAKKDVTLSLNFSEDQAKALYRQLDLRFGKKDEEEDIVEDDAEFEEEDDQEEEEQEEVTLELVRQKLGEHMRKNGAPETKKLLEGFGASKVSELDEDDWPDVIEAAA